MKLTETEIEEIKLLVKLKYIPFRLTYEYFLNLPTPVFLRLYRETISAVITDTDLKSEQEKLNRAHAFVMIYTPFIENKHFMEEFEERIIRLCIEYYSENTINER